MKHTRDLTAHTAEGCGILRLAEVGIVTHMILASNRESVSDKERATFAGWMDARRCFPLTTRAMIDDPLTLFDREVFASTCTICRKSTVLGIDQHKKFQTVECHMEGNVPSSEPRQFDPDTCLAARHLLMTTAISEIKSFDSARLSPDFIIDVESFERRWTAALDMMGWKRFAPATASADLGSIPRVGARLVTGILCETCDDVIAVQAQPDGIRIVLCPFHI